MADLNLPKWAYAVGAVGLVGGVLLYKKAKASQQQAEKQSENATESPTVVYQNPAEEAPETYYPGGVEPIGNAIESEQEFREFFNEQQSRSREERQEQAATAKSEHESLQAAITSALGKLSNTATSQGSGGGVPSGGGAGGSTQVEPPQSQRGAESCARQFQNYPFYNPNNGNASPHSCYKDGCANNQLAHIYKDGHKDVVGGPC